MPYILPLVPSVPNYTVSTTMFNVGYTFNVRWNGRDAAWYFDVLTEAGAGIAYGLKLVLGTLVGRRIRDFDKLPGYFIVTDTSGAGADASLDDMGTRVVVTFYHFQEIGLLVDLGLPVG